MRVCTIETDALLHHGCATQDGCSESMGYIDVELEATGVITSKPSPFYGPTSPECDLDDVRVWAYTDDGVRYEVTGMFSNERLRRFEERLWSSV